MRHVIAGLVLAVMLPVSVGCTKSAPSGNANGTAGKTEAGQEAAQSGRLSARQAVDLAYDALQAEWKPNARLAFVGRYSRYMNRQYPPIDVEQDPGIGSDGLQEHWVVIFGDVAAGQAQVFYVEKGSVELVAEDLATIRPAQYFDREGWVDSTKIAFKEPKRVGLELKTNEAFAGVDPDLSAHPLLWLAETSFGRYDIYDATTGEYIKSR